MLKTDSIKSYIEELEKQQNQKKLYQEANKENSLYLFKEMFGVDAIYSGEEDGIVFLLCDGLYFAVNEVSNTISVRLLYHWYKVNSKADLGRLLLS
jgi:hypothetical protein